MIPEAKSRWPIHLEPKNPTMNKKLIVTVCPTGMLITRDQNPKQPYTPKEIAQQTIAAYKEGAAEVHVHTRDEYGYMGVDAEQYIETTEMILKECPDIVLCPSISVTPKKAEGNLFEVETTQLLIDSLSERGKSRGRKYIETAAITSSSYVSTRAIRPERKEPPASIVTPQMLRAEAEFLQSKGIRPNFLGHSFEGIDNVIEYLIEPGILHKPYVISLCPGMHKPSTKTYPDPWGMIYLINMKEYLMSKVPNDTVIGASIGGHNWLPITVLAFMLGVDFVRVGMEDSMWLYPHKDDLIESCAQVTRKIVTIAKELGREIATPEEARAIYHIK